MGETKGVPLTRRSVLKATGAGAAGTTGLVAFSGTAVAHCPCDTCVQVGKIEDEDIDGLSEGDTFEFLFEGDDLVIEITNIEREDGEPVSVDIKTRPDLQDTNIGHSLCQVNVKGGPDTEVYDCTSSNAVDDCGEVGNDADDETEFCYDGDTCVSKADDLQAPPTNNPNRDFYGISHITVFACDFNGSDDGLGGTCTV